MAMEEELNYREELEKARKVASQMELRGYESEIEAYWEVICGLVLLAEEDLQERDHQWEIASLAREFLTYAEQLAQYEHMMDKLYEAAKRMIGTVYEHPRLKSQLLSFEIGILEEVQAQQFHPLGILDDLRNELAELQERISRADRGELLEPVEVGHLKHDPIEWSARWEEIIDEYKIAKVIDIVEGGDTGHDSTRNGIFSLKGKISEDDFVIIHDAARPILPQRAIEDMLTVAHQKGNASLAIPCYETVIYTDDSLSGNEQLDRSKIMRIQTPQAYKYGSILPLYERAEKENKHDFIYADLVLIYYGQTVYFSKGFQNNIKITRKEDIPLCKALMNFSEEELYS